MVASLALAVALQGKTEITTPEVVGVSMFKNGFAFVTRKIALKNGEANVVEVPKASLGTLWFWTPDGEIKRISTADNLIKGKKEVNLASFDQLVSKNVGKSVYVESHSAPPVEGKIKQADGDLLVIETQNGSTAILKNSIKYIKSSDEKFEWKQTIETTSEEKFYRIEAEKGTKEVIMMSLERGMTWAPGYAIDLSKDTKLTLASKATIFNDLISLKSIGVRLITGFPNLQFKDILDPFTAGMSGDNWVNALSGVPSGPGGLGGGGRGRANEMLTQNAFRAAPAEDINWGGSAGPEVGGEQLGDLFFYDIEKFESKKGSRTYQNLFRFDSDYQHIYTWDIDDQVDASGNYRPVPANQPPAPEEVWHTIRFKNVSGRPLTTAVATIFNKGQLIGQTMMNYTPAGADCDVRINKALNVRAEQSEEEVNRERGAIRDQNNYPRWDLVTVKGTLEAANLTSETLTMTITKSLTGDFVNGTGEPKVVKTTKGLRQINSSAKLTWKPTVKGGEKLRLEYTYKLFVPSN